MDMNTLKSGRSDLLANQGVHELTPPPSFPPNPDPQGWVLCQALPSHHTQTRGQQGSAWQGRPPEKVWGGARYPPDGRSSVSESLCSLQVSPWPNSSQKEARGCGLSHTAPTLPRPPPTQLRRGSGAEAELALAWSPRLPTLTLGVTLLGTCAHLWGQGRRDPPPPGFQQSG